MPDSEQPGFDQIPDAQLGREAYSEGVRQLVWKHARQAPGFRVVSRSASYLTDWSESQVALTRTLTRTRTRTRTRGRKKN